MRNTLIWLLFWLVAFCVNAQIHKENARKSFAPATTSTAAPAVTTVQPTCSTPTGTITITDPVGEGYFFTISGGIYGGGSTINSTSTPFSFNNLASGVTYSITTTPFFGTASPATSVTINPVTATPATPTATPTSPATCGALGTITVTSPTGANIKYSIDGTNYQTSNSFSNLSSGPYSVTAIDGNSCASPALSLTIGSPPSAPPTPTASVTVQPDCALATGTISVTAPLGANYVYSVDGITYQSSPLFTGLASGNYSVTVKNSPSGCISPFLPLTVNSQPTTPTTPVVAATQPTCSTATGTLVVSAQNATDSYSFDNGVTFQAGNSKTALPPDTYNVIIQSAGGCTSTASQVTINTQPVTPTTPAFNIIQPTCGTPTGTVTITPQLAGETYSFDNGATFQASNAQAGLNPNPYNLIIKSAGGCNSIAATATITASLSSPNMPVINIKQPTCTLPGEIAVTPQTAGETYSFDNGATFQASYYKPLPGGNYQVIIKNTSGCNSVATPATINAQPTTPTAPVVSTTQPNCGTPSGAITVTPQLAGETYSFDGGVSYQTNNVKTGLSSGAYNILIKSAGGCISVMTPATINVAPVVPSSPAVTPTQPSCTVATGTLTVTIQNATDSYSFDNGTTFQASNVKTGLIANNYQVVIKSTSGCSSTATVTTITTAPTTPTTPVLTSTQPSCATPTGAITVTPQLASDSYSFDNGTTFQASNTKSGLTGNNTYNVLIKSAGGCISVMTPTTINAAPVVPSTPVVTPTQPSCAVATGTLTVTIQNATDSYSFDNGTTFQASNVKTGLIANNYQVVIKSTSGCSSATTSTLITTQPGSPTTPALSLIQPNCTTATGTITVSIQNASDSYSFDGGTTFQASNIKSGVVAGSYDIYIKNTSGCISSASATINAQPPTPATPVSSITQPTCALATGTIAVTSPVGLNYSIDGSDYSNTSGIFSGLAVGTYQVTARNSSGCISASKSETIIESIPAIPTVSKIQPTCTVSTGTITISAPTGAIYSYSIDGTNYQSSTSFSNVASGTYTVSVKNTNSGCISTTPNITIDPQPPTPNAPTINLTQPNCLIATGTITVTDPIVAGTSFSIDGTTYTNTTGVFTNLGVASYPVTAKNSNGCISASTQGIILSPVFTLPKSDFELSTYSIDNKYNSVNGSITPENNVTYNWDLGDGTSNLTGSAFVTHFYNIKGNEGEIIVTLTATDLIGCNSTTTKSIVVTPFIPNVFTPNGDAYNDSFMPNFDMQVFDRQGILLYTGNTESKGWDGTYKGQKVDPDTYFYILHYLDSKKNVRTKKGFVTLIR